MNTRLLPTRALTLGAAVAFALAMVNKLWGMVLVSTFYYDGLKLNIYATKVTGDLSELNILNHYIGMMNIDNSLTEFRWIPWVFGLIVLMSLVMTIWPNRKVLISGTVLTLVGLGAMGGDFYYRLYQYGHDFLPDAAIEIPGFTPKIMGHYMLANFDVTTKFGWGGLFAFLGVILLLMAVFYRPDREAEAKL